MQEEGFEENCRRLLTHAAPFLTAIFVLVALLTCPICQDLGLRTEVWVGAVLGWLIVGSLALLASCYVASWFAFLLIGFHAGIMLTFPELVCILCLLIFIAEFVAGTFIALGMASEFDQQFAPIAATAGLFGGAGILFGLMVGHFMPRVVLPGQVEPAVSHTLYIVFDNDNMEDNGGDTDSENVDYNLPDDLENADFLNNVVAFHGGEEEGLNLLRIVDRVRSDSYPFYILRSGDEYIRIASGLSPREFLGSEAFRNLRNRTSRSSSP